MKDNSSKNTNIWYLFHSGFAVKTSKHFLIFDYYIDKPEGAGIGLDSGVISPEEIKDLDIMVFSSHEHHDHFNPVIFGWETKVKKISYVLSYDIKAGGDKDNILRVRPGKQYDFQGVNITVLDSTDIGVAFVVECDGLSIFHAGDLNWWHWEGEPEDENLSMAKNYKRQIDLLKNKHIDISFIPVDPRLEKQYLLGLDYFMKTVGAEMVFPMHFGKNHSIFEWLKKDKCAEEYLKKIAEISRRGQKFTY